MEDKIVMCPYNNKKVMVFDTNIDQVIECIELEYTKMYSNIGIYNDTALTCTLSVRCGHRTLRRQLDISNA